MNCRSNYLVKLDWYSRLPALLAIWVGELVVMCLNTCVLLVSERQCLRNHLPDFVDMFLYLFIVYLICNQQLEYCSYKIRRKTEYLCVFLNWNVTHSFVHKQ